MDLKMAEGHAETPRLNHIWVTRTFETICLEPNTFVHPQKTFSIRVCEWNVKSDACVPETVRSIERHSSTVTCSTRRMISNLIYRRKRKDFNGILVRRWQRERLKANLQIPNRGQPYRRGQPFREFNTGGTEPKVKQRVFPTPRESEFEAAVASLDQTLVRRKSEYSAAPTTKMYSPGVLQYNSRLTEVTPMENNFVLDLSIRTPEDTNGCHAEGIYADDRLLSPETRSNHSGDSNGCNGSPTFLALPASATTRAGKPTRPFKAYPKNFLGLGMTEGIIPDDSNVRYMEFRRQFLSQLHAANGNNGGNKNMKRPVQSVSPNQVPSSSGDAKDQAYWEKRRKNNEAAKKSRDARRAKEDEIAIRAAFLERENLQLRLELASLKGEVERLRCVLYANN